MFYLRHLLRLGLEEDLLRRRAKCAFNTLRYAFMNMYGASSGVKRRTYTIVEFFFVRWIFKKPFLRPRCPKLACKKAILRSLNISTPVSWNTGQNMNRSCKPRLCFDNISGLCLLQTQPANALGSIIMRPPPYPPLLFAFFLVFRGVLFP